MSILKQIVSQTRKIRINLHSNILVDQAVLELLIKTYKESVLIKNSRTVWSTTVETR